MRSTTLLILATLFQQVVAKGLEANKVDDAQGPEYYSKKLADKLIDRVIQAPAHNADLDETTFAKAPAGTTVARTNLVGPQQFPRSAPPSAGNRRVNPMQGSYMQQHNLLANSRPRVDAMASRAPAVQNALKKYGIGSSPRDEHVPTARDVSAAAEAVQAPPAEDMKVPVYDLSKNSAGDATLDGSVFGLEPRIDLITDKVRWERSKARFSTASTLTRTEVNFGGKKLYAQKKTGNSRAGDRASPLRKKGGVSWGPKPRGFEFDLNRKVKDLGLRHALSAAQKDGKVVILSNTDVKTDRPTKEAAASLKNFGEGKFFIVYNGAQSAEERTVNENFKRATRNMPSVITSPQNSIQVKDIVNADHLMITQDALKALQSRLNQ